MKRPNDLLQASAILNTLFSAVVIAFLLDPNILYQTAFWLGCPAKLLPLFLFLAVPLQVFVFSGLLPAFLQLASGEIILFEFRKFQDNAWAFWKIYCLFASLPFLLDLGLWISQPGRRTSFFSAVDLFTFPVLYVLARIFIDHLYLKPWNIPARRNQITLSSALGCLGLYFGSVFLFALSRYCFAHHLPLARLVLFLVKYMTFLSFIYLTLLILKNYPEIPSRLTSTPELYLINPGGSGIFMNFSNTALRFYPPLFVVLKALTPKHYRIREFNKALWRERYYQGQKLVAITCLTTNSAEAYTLAKEFRRHGSKVILGGPHASVLPDEALEFCDAVVIGEAESVWPDIIRDYENNSLKPKYHGEPCPSWHPEVFRELLQSSPEVIKYFLETSRGCHHHCEFCATPYLTGATVRKKRVADIVALIRKVKTKHPHVGFLDDNIYSDPSYARELFEALKPLKIRWAGKSSVDIAQNDDILRLAVDSGCSSLMIGYEISGGSPEKSQGGKMALADKYLTLSRKIKRQGIRIKAHFILGFDSDDFKSLLRLWFFCLRLRPTAIGMTLLTPMLGSPLFDRMLTEERLTTLNWRNYSTTSLVFHPKRFPRLILSLVYPVTYFLIFFTSTSLGNVVLLAALLLGKILLVK